jgi:diadenosine tetraphosphate (Ap4A) HIT family hydrolase
MFTLDARLANDTICLGKLELCQVLLMNNKQYPWLILVPERENIKEIIDLDHNEQVLLMEEIARVSHAIKNLYAPDKINIAALGNMVPQLHVHIIARFKTDTTWPYPVWQKDSVTVPYEEDEKINVAQRLCSELQKIKSFTKKI